MVYYNHQSYVDTSRSWIYYAVPYYYYYYYYYYYCMVSEPWMVDVWILFLCN